MMMHACRVTLFAIFILTFRIENLHAQDFNILKTHIEQAEFKPLRWHNPQLKFHPDPLKMALGSAMFLYQKVFTYHMGAECMYHPSCSEFSRQAIAEFGIMKGGLLTLDRLTRCNGLERRTRGMRREKDGRWYDPPQNYAGK